MRKYKPTNRQMAELRKYLRIYRAANELKADELAKKLNISRGHYFHLETGGRIPHLKKFIKIAGFLKIPEKEVKEILLKYYKNAIRIYISNNIGIKKISDEKLFEIYELLTNAEPIEKEESKNEK